MMLFRNSQSIRSEHSANEQVMEGISHGQNNKN